MPNLIAHTCGTHKSTVNAMGMREMQSRAFDARNAQYLPYQGSADIGQVSRADVHRARQDHQSGPRKDHACRPRTLHRQFGKTTPLKPSGFFADWLVAPKYNLTTSGGGQKTGQDSAKWDPARHCAFERCAL